MSINGGTLSFLVIVGNLQGWTGGEPSASPGTLAGCWDDYYTFEKCCLGDEDCWPDGDVDEGMANCCTGLYDEQLRSINDSSANEMPLHQVTPHSHDALELLSCARGGVNRTSPLLHTPLSGSNWFPSKHPFLSRNNMMRACTCLARHSGADVILDLFMGGGNSANAFAQGLSSQTHRQGPTHRMPELFTFEDDNVKVKESTRFGGLMAKWQPLMHRVRTSKDITRWRRLLNSPPYSMNARPKVWIVEGTPYPGSGAGAYDKPYTYNALDVLCQHRAPIEIVMMDPGHRNLGISEWLIIETVCKPQWVVLSNINAPRSGTGWLYTRLSLMKNWTLELTGHYTLNDEELTGTLDLTRIRAWAVFSQRWRR